MVSQDYNCTVGRDPVSSFTSEEDLSFTVNNKTLYLDRNSSFTCNGTVNTWRFCYYFDTDRMDLSDEDYIGVWRPQINSSFYKLVNGSLLNLRDATDTFEMVDFVCVRHAVSQFYVHEEDVIGAVISSNSSAFSLVRPAAGGTLTIAMLLPDDNASETSESRMGYALHIGAYFEGT